jgi:2-(1,2-epoxy-1,2-dihydrophenyl)acetyl-CoA isomerase
VSPSAAGSTGHIRYEVDGDGIGTITIDRPEKKNAMSYAVLRDFNATIAQAADDDASRVVILTGVPGSFCAGTDLSDLSDTPTDERGSAAGGDGARPQGPWPLVQCPKPVIAAVDGPAVGMGAEFTTQCDVRILSSRARVAWNFVHRGLVPDTGAGSWLLPRIVGLPKALDLVFSGEFLDAATALEIGFAKRVVEPEQVLDAAREEATRYLAGSPFAIRLAKRLMYEGLEKTMTDHARANGEAMAKCFASEDHKEGVASFLERRPAKFVGR